ncbi:ABC transporter substrate-binding protein [Starkeya sp. ORNL1]|uniref:molybdate ABC transporter substrate-binding protein n=1 Tax=Starkeya sp. ORNL1 TaxID=2709380 RepID=UPI001462F17F|nr:substrate-binding domain-containing protein [Starkeya sp. ORNL1]QJP12233.1 ABC transporter substrate-binding protein [Starkeya sp. ORNL1]
MTSSAQPAIDILSAGAVKTLLADLARAFLDRDGTRSRLTFDTAPAITRRIEDGEPCDVLVAPPAVLAGLSGSGRFAVGRKTPLARVGIGMVGRVGQQAPDISTEAAVTAALLDATAIIINQASTGLYLEKMLSRLGIFERVADRLVRLPTGRAVMERMADAPPDHIGFGAVTEIEVHKALGVRLAALLPEQLQNYTNYEAASSAAPQAHRAADRFIAFIGSPDSDACFTASGVERI